MLSEQFWIGMIIGGVVHTIILAFFLAIRRKPAPVAKSTESEELQIPQYWAVLAEWEDDNDRWVKVYTYQKPEKENYEYVVGPFVSGKECEQYCDHANYDPDSEHKNYLRYDKSNVPDEEQTQEEPEPKEIM